MKSATAFLKLILRISLSALQAIPTVVMAKAVRKNASISPAPVADGLLVEVPQTLGNAQDHFANYSAAAEAKRQTLTASISMSMSQLLATKISVRGSTPQVLDYQLAIPNLEVRIYTRELGHLGRISFRAFSGAGFAWLNRKKTISLPSGPVTDRQNLYSGQWQFGGEWAAGPVKSWSALRLGAEALAAPTFAFTNRSLASDGRSYQAWSAQVAFSLQYLIFRGLSAAAKIGYRWSKLSLKNDNAIGYAFAVEQRF